MRSKASYLESNRHRLAWRMLERLSYATTVEPSGVQALKNPNPLKDVEALAVLVVAVLV